MNCPFCNKSMTPHPKYLKQFWCPNHPFGMRYILSMANDQDDYFFVDPFQNTYRIFYYTKVKHLAIFKHPWIEIIKMNLPIFNEAALNRILNLKAFL